MRKAYLLVAIFLISVFSGLAYTASYLFRAEAHYNNVSGLLSALTTETSFLGSLADAALTTNSASEMNALRGLIKSSTTRLTMAHKTVLLGHAGIISDQNLAEIKDHIERVSRSASALRDSKNLVDIQFFATALRDQTRLGTALDLDHLVRSQRQQLQNMDRLVMNLFWLLIPIQAFVYWLVWVRLIVPIIEKQKAIYRELRDAKERAVEMADAAIKADAVKSQFLNSFSHELRTPLNGILGVAEDLFRNGKRHSKREDLIFLIENAEALNMLINELIDRADIGEEVRFNFDDFMKTYNRKYEAKKKHRSAISDQKLLKDVSILVADDNKTNRVVMSKLVKALGGQADIVEDGLKAVQAFTKSPYDLLLLDIKMPNKSGVEALHEIRKIERKKKLQPSLAIAVTANTLRHELEEYKKVGFAECVSKPINRSKLAGTLVKQLA